MVLYSNPESSLETARGLQMARKLSAKRLSQTMTIYRKEIIRQKAALRTAAKTSSLYATSSTHSLGLLLIRVAAVYLNGKLISTGISTKRVTLAITQSAETLSHELITSEVTIETSIKRMCLGGVLHVAPMSPSPFGKNEGCQIRGGDVDAFEDCKSQKLCV